MAHIWASARGHWDYVKTHPFFNFLVIRMRSSSYSDRLNYFSSPPASINRDWISKFRTLFHALRFPLFLTPLSGIFSLMLKGSKGFSLKNFFFVSKDF